MKTYSFNAFIIMSLVLFSLTNFASSQKSSQGIFKASSDIGNPKLEGSAIYNSQNQEYSMKGAGYNIWFERDEFHYLWRKIKGDFILKARVEFVGKGVEAHRKIGWMVRNDLTAGSQHVSAVVHGDGLTSLQYRDTTGGVTKEVRSADQSPDFIQLERKVNSYYMSTGSGDEPLETVGVENILLNDKVYVGLFICSHNPEIIEKAIFRDVSITKLNTDEKHRK